MLLLNQVCQENVAFHPITHTSLTVSTLSCINLPVVVSNLAIALSVALPGHTTSPLHPPVLAIVIIQSALVPVVVRVIPLHSTN